MPRPRPTLFEVRYSAKPNCDNHWRIVGFINGNRTQYWFKSEQDAKAAADDKNAEITAHGTQVAFSAVDRLRAFNAIERLSPFKKNLEDGANFYVAHLTKTEGSKTSLNSAKSLVRNLKNDSQTGEQRSDIKGRWIRVSKSSKPALVLLPSKP
jgi:hypothetical protein